MVYKIFDWVAQQLGREISLHKIVNWLKQGNKIGEIIMNGLSCKSISILMEEVLKTLCKDKRKRKTTQASVELGISFECLYTKGTENKQFVEA